MEKIDEARQILAELGVEEVSPKIGGYTLLALAQLKPEDPWSAATRQSLTLSQGIMDFANSFYGTDYKPNTRESVRKLALKPLVDSGVVALNPDNPSLRPSSSKTHYALTPIGLATVQKFGSAEWDSAVARFKQVQAASNRETKILLRRISIKSFKSIVDDKIELGRLNVFIGANGSGKSNVLEAVAFIGAARDNDLSLDGLYSRGVRFARPSLTLSAFPEIEDNGRIEMSLAVDVDGQAQELSTSLVPTHIDRIYSGWYDLKSEDEYPEMMVEYMQGILASNPLLSGDNLLRELNSVLRTRSLQETKLFDRFLTEYSIYDLNTKALRGISPPESRKTPLGLNGEGLDLLISSFGKGERDQLKRCYDFFDWLEDIISESGAEEAYQTLRAGKSISNLYFTDRYMDVGNKTLSAENSNEGILHVLFYLSLFISKKTPKFFGIDNIETALNPRLCRVLIKELARIAKENDKQALITTHNPAVLDGLNLQDDDQRLFEVFRTDEGFTKTRRIKFKDDLSDKTGKLSQMWLSGALGATPKNF